MAYNDSQYEYTNGYFSGTAAAVGTIPCLTYTDLAFSISGLTGETIGVQTSQDGGTTWNTTAIRPIITTTGATAGSSALGNGSYKINVCPFSAVKFVKSATTENVAIIFGMFGVVR